MSEQPWTVRRVLGWTAQHFEKLGVDVPRLTAELLLAHVLDTSPGAALHRPRPAAGDRRARRLPGADRSGAPRGAHPVPDRPARVLRPAASASTRGCSSPAPRPSCWSRRCCRRCPPTRAVRVLDLCTGQRLRRASPSPLERPPAPGGGHRAVARGRWRWRGPTPTALGRGRPGRGPPRATSSRRVEAERSLRRGGGQSALRRRGQSSPRCPAEVRREPRLRARRGRGRAGRHPAHRRRSPTAWLVPGGLLALEIGDGQGPRGPVLARGGRIWLRPHRTRPRPTRSPGLRDTAPRPGGHAPRRGKPWTRSTLKAASGWRARSSVSGSKNATLPLMAAALLGEGPTTLRNVPDLADVTTLLQLLRTMGVEAERVPGAERHVVRIHAAGGRGPRGALRPGPEDARLGAGARARCSPASAGPGSRCPAAAPSAPVPSTSTSRASGRSGRRSRSRAATSRPGPSGCGGPPSASTRSPSPAPRTS